MSIDLRALMRDIAVAATKCVGATAAQTHGGAQAFEPHLCDAVNGTRAQSVTLSASAGEWRVKVTERGAKGAALDAAAVLALREQLERKRDERARLLAADDAALRVIDETARVYDAATIAEACGVLAEGTSETPAEMAARLPNLLFAGCGYPAPWPRSVLAREGSALLDACDAILRRRAAEAPQGGGRLVLPADVVDGVGTVRAPGREP